MFDVCSLNLSLLFGSFSNMVLTLVSEVLTKCKESPASDTILNYLYLFRSEDDPCMLDNLVFFSQVLSKYFTLLIFERVS